MPSRAVDTLDVRKLAELVAPVGKEGLPIGQASKADQATYRIAPDIIEQSGAELASGASLEGRVDELDPSFEVTPEMLEKLDQDIDVMKANPDKFSEKEINWMVELRQIVLKAYEQDGKKSENDQIKLDKLKNEFKQAVEAGSDLQKQLGLTGLVVALVFTGVFLAQFGVPGAFSGKTDVWKANCSKTFDFASKQGDAIGGVFTNSIQARMKEKGGEESLALNQLQHEQGKSQGREAVKQEVSETYKTALQSLREVNR
jgi:hypothetical protein